MMKAIPLLLAVFLLLSVVSADDLATEREKGKELAKESLGPVLDLIFNNQVLHFRTGDEIIQFFASAILVYFLLTQILGAGGFPIILGTFIILVLLQNFLVMNWVTFLVDLSPAILVYLLIIDLSAFTVGIAPRTAKLMGVFGFALTYWFHPTRKIFDDIFGNLYQWTTGFMVFLFFILIGFARLFSVMSAAASSTQANEARRSLHADMEKFYELVMKELREKQ